MDPLVPIPKENWPAVRDTFKAWWPHGMPGYYALNTEIPRPGLQTAFDFTVLCPYGDMNNGVVALLCKGSRNEVIILPNSKDTSKLEEALVDTKRIKWSEVAAIPFCEMDALKLARKVCQKLGLPMKEYPTIKHFLPKDYKPYELNYPPNTYMAELKPEHCHQVDLPWPHRYPTSEKFFQRLIENGLSYGLFSTENNNLLAWQLINEVGFFTHLYTEKEHRGKGYGEFVVKYATNDQIKKGNDVFCYIVEGNIPSMSLFRKLEYEVIGRGVWVEFVKKTDTPVKSPL